MTVAIKLGAIMLVCALVAFGAGSLIASYMV
jgi:hypothetical protein